MPNCLPFSRRMATPGWPGRLSCPFIIPQKLAGAVVILPRQQPSGSGSQPSAGANRRIDDSAVGHASQRDYWCLGLHFVGARTFGWPCVWRMDASNQLMTDLSACVRRRLLIVCAPLKPVGQLGGGSGMPDSPGRGSWRRCSHCPHARRSPLRWLNRARWRPHWLEGDGSSISMPMPSSC
jgi:hypothetical protein